MKHIIDKSCNVSFKVDQGKGNFIQTYTHGLEKEATIEIENNSIVTILDHLKRLVIKETLKPSEKIFIDNKELKSTKERELKDG